MYQTVGMLIEYLYDSMRHELPEGEGLGREGEESVSYRMKLGSAGGLYMLPDTKAERSWRVDMEGAGVEVG